MKNNHFKNDILALHPERINDVLEARKVAVIPANFDAAQANAIRATQFKNVSGEVAVVPLHGFMEHHPTLWTALGLEPSTEIFSRWMDDLVNNDAVGAIVISVDSPGGTVMGLQTAAEKLFALRDQKKPIVAVVNDLMASAAYFLASAAKEIVADPDALTGSIGTIAVHLDWSKYLEEAGITPTIIKAAPFKDEGSPLKPLSEEAKENIQEMINAYYNIFVAAVARHRGVTSSVVKSDFGGGRVLMAPAAKAAGMIDRIGTLEAVVAALRGQKSMSKSRAQNELSLIRSRGLRR